MARPLPLDTRRTRKGVSLRQVARDLRVPFPTVYVHHRKDRIPSLRYALLYAKYYGCSPEAILKSYAAKEAQS